METLSKLKVLAKKAEQTKGTLLTEEATKNALIMPFLAQVLGYDVFDPTEVVPEYTADTGIKKGEKVDYALLNEGVVQIIIEAKKAGEELKTEHASQLFRYFSVTNARIAVLTNGTKYKFYTDLDEPNKMDGKPFLTIDLENIDEHVVPDLKKLTKQSFDLNAVLDAAGELKYMTEVKNVLGQMIETPDDDFIRVFASRIVSGAVTAKVREQFAALLPNAINQFINDKINARLKMAIGETEQSHVPVKVEDANNKYEPEIQDDSGIVTTEEELEGYMIVKAITCKVLGAERIKYRDNKHYFTVIADDNNRKPICRLHFNGKQKYMVIVDENREATRFDIDALEEIYQHTEQLIKKAQIYA